MKWFYWRAFFTLLNYGTDLIFRQVDSLTNLIQIVMTLTLLVAFWLERFKETP